MTYKEVLQAAQGQMGPCRACPVCNGRACGGTIPGPGAKGSGTVAIRNFDAWRNVRLNMDTIHENFEPDTSLTLFGRSFKYPFFAGPVGAMTLHYGDKYNDLDYNNILVPACAAAGIAAFTGDGTNHKVMEGAAAAITACGGAGIPTVKPWDNATVARKIALARSSGCFAMAMDIDAAGLPFLQHLDPPAGSKTVEQLKEIALAAGVPFILKGIMTVKGAEKAIEAGAAGGDEKCQMALDMFNYRVSQLFAEMAASMEGVDTMAFTAGIGENAPEMRAGVANRLAWMGVKIDDEKNAIRSDEPRVISTPDSAITVMVVPTNEEYMIALDVEGLLG